METRDGAMEATVVDSSAGYASVLDECQTIGGMAVQSLRWHYRSRHESLIAFSNNRFYKGDLVTFPAALDKHPALGLQFVHLADGVYDRGGKRHNLREAVEVADLVFEHFRRMTNAVREVVRNLVRAGAVSQDGEFLWTASARKRARSIVRTPLADEDETLREIKHIPPQELQNAMLLTVQHAVGISLESLIAATRRLFGFNRSGGSIKERLLAELEGLQRNGLLSVHDGRVSLDNDV